jgi:hypothetical protein
MKRLLLVAVAALFSIVAASAQWAPAGDNLKTHWGENLDPENVWPEYPRPIMERAEWDNLNGLWNYAIRPAGEAKPAEFDGQILVPFAVESSLSGVMKPSAPKTHSGMSAPSPCPPRGRANR